MRTPREQALSVAGVPLIQFLMKTLRKINFPRVSLGIAPQNLIHAFSGGDAAGGNTRGTLVPLHPEHDGQDPDGR